jgi:hypothetical protein
MMSFIYSRYQSSKATATILSSLVVAALASLLYGRAIEFAFFNDDPTGHFAWMEGRSFLDFFTDSAGYGYYRPVVFVFLKLTLGLWGGYYAPGFHALLILLHASNTALLWLLAFYLTRHRPYAWLVALAFAFMPFSYEAVAYVASLTHPLLVFWTLLTLLLYRQMQATGFARYLVGAHITLILGLFSHENGLFIPLALAGLEWLTWQPPEGWRSKQSKSVVRRLIPFFIAPFLFILLWLTIPKASEQSWPSPERIVNNLAPFLQTLIYPLLPFFHLNAADRLALISLSLVTLIAFYLLARLARVERLWLFSLAWIGFSAAPSILFLNSAYLYGSPRLQYLPSIGVALFWGLPLLALAQLSFTTSTRPFLIVGLQAGLALAVLLPPLPFIRCQLDFYEQVSQIVRSMSDSARAAPPDRELLFINVPFFFSSYPSYPNGCPNPYPWTPVGGIVAPPYAQLRDFVRFNRGPDRPVHSFTFAAYSPGWNTHGAPLPFDALPSWMRHAYVYVFDLSSPSFFSLSAIWRPEIAAPSPALATFDGVELVGKLVSRRDEQIDVTLHWHTRDAPQRALTIFVHLYDAAGALIAQHDGPPAQNYVPTLLWQPGDVVYDRHTLALPVSLAAGAYTLAVGMYDSLTGERLPATAGGAALPDNIYKLEQVTQP